MTVMVWDATAGAWRQPETATYGELYPVPPRPCPVIVTADGKILPAPVTIR